MYNSAILKPLLEFKIFFFKFGFVVRVELRHILCPRRLCRRTSEICRRFSFREMQRNPIRQSDRIRMERNLQENESALLFTL